jgi:hypothetical protein
VPADQRPTGGSTTTGCGLPPTAPRASGNRLGQPRRRSLLAAAVAVPALASAGCSLRFGQPEAAPEPAAPTADEQARARAARDAEALAVLATWTATFVPSAARALRTIIEEHRAHVGALRVADAATDSPRGAAAGAPTPATSSTPSSRRSALHALAAREHLAVSAVETDLAAVGPDLARLLASVAACREVHVSVLAQLAARERA